MLMLINWSQPKNKTSWRFDEYLACIPSCQTELTSALLMNLPCRAIAAPQLSWTEMADMGYIEISAAYRWPL
jgi:hypothetical protein